MVIFIKLIQEKKSPAKPEPKKVEEKKRKAEDSDKETPAKKAKADKKDKKSSYSSSLAARLFSNLDRNYETIEDVKKAIIANPGGKPKKEEKFGNWVKNTMKCTNEDWIKDLWTWHKDRSQKKTCFFLYMNMIFLRFRCMNLRRFLTPQLDRK